MLFVTKNGTALGGVPTPAMLCTGSLPGADRKQGGGKEKGWWPARGEKLQFSQHILKLQPLLSTFSPAARAVLEAEGLPREFWCPPDTYVARERAPGAGVLRCTVLPQQAQPSLL